MKQLYWSILFGAALGVVHPVSGQTYYEQNFDGFAVGDYIGSQDSWMTWSDNPGSTEDAQISDDFAASGANSLHIFQTAQAGGPMDVVFVSGISEGHINVSFKMYVPSGGSAYYNFQEATTPGTAWAFDVVFANVGQFLVSIDQTPAGTGDFPLDAWFEMNHDINLDTDEVTISIDGTEVGTFAYDGAAFGGINFFGFGDEIELGNYFIDDLMVAEAVSVQEFAPASLEFNMGPNPARNSIVLQSNVDNAQVRVLGLNGQLVQQMNGLNLRQGFRMDFNLNEGIYFVEVVNAGQRSIQRLVVQN